MLPPLMFTEEEIEALVLGSRWVAERADARLGAGRAQCARQDRGGAAGGAAGRCSITPRCWSGRASRSPAGDAELPAIRQAIRNERKIAIAYRDDKMRETRRTIWPFALGYFDRVRIVVAWCELRRSFRHFRADRIVALDAHRDALSAPAPALLKEWREAEGIPAAISDLRACASSRPARN